MIDRHVLRIGNIVSRRYYNPQPHNEHYAEQQCIICALMENTVTVRHGEKDRLKQPYTNISGIKIDYFHLKKLGFEVTRTIGGFERWQKGEFRLIDGKLPDMQSARSIEFVHELQNLYLDITGEKL